MNNRFTFFIKEIIFRILYFSFSFFLCFLVCFLNKDYYFFLLIKPLFSFFFQSSWELNYIQPFDLLLSHIYLSSFYSFLICIPIFFIHFSLYFINSWQKQEYLFSIVLILFSFFSTFISYKLAFNFVFPNVWSFFKIIETNSSIVSYTLFPTIQPLIFFCFIIFIFLILNLHFPIFFFFLFKKQIFSFWSIFSHRNFIYFIFFFIATLLSPPDVISQFILSFFLIVFFEINCFLFLFFFFILQTW